MQPILNIQFTVEQLRGVRDEIRRVAGEAAQIEIEFVSEATGEVQRIKRRVSLAAIEALLARVDAHERAQKN